MSRRTANRIVVPSRAINGGMDFKFEADPYNIRLHGLLTEDDYRDSIQQINQVLHPSRSTKLDAVLLATGPLMLPLAAWGIRHGRQTKKRKRLLKVAIEDFHNTHPALLMRWNRRPDSCLSIELRPEPQATLIVPPPPPSAEAVLALAGEENNHNQAAVVTNNTALSSAQATRNRTVPTTLPQQATTTTEAHDLLV